jgi:hypothetical protein
MSLWLSLLFLFSRGRDVRVPAILWDASFTFCFPDLLPCAWIHDAFSMSFSLLKYFSGKIFVILNASYVF